MLRLRDLDDYEFTERIRNNIAACYTVFVEDNSTETDSKLRPMKQKRLNPAPSESATGRKVTVAQPPSKDGFGEYTKANLRGIASGTGASYASDSTRRLLQRQLLLRTEWDGSSLRAK